MRLLRLTSPGHTLPHRILEISTHSWGLNLLTKWGLLDGDQSSTQNTRGGGIDLPWFSSYGVFVSRFTGLEVNHRCTVAGTDPVKGFSCYGGDYPVFPEAIPVSFSPPPVPVPMVELSTYPPVTNPINKFSHLIRLLELTPPKESMNVIQDESRGGRF